MCRKRGYILFSPYVAYMIQFPSLQVTSFVIFMFRGIYFSTKAVVLSRLHCLFSFASLCVTKIIHLEQNRWWGVYGRAEEDIKFSQAREVRQIENGILLVRRILRKYCTKIRNNAKTLNRNMFQFNPVIAELITTIPSSLQRQPKTSNFLLITPRIPYQIIPYR